MKVEIVEKDRGWKKFFQKVEELKKGDPHVRVGVFADEKSGGDVREDGFTNVEIAAVHEFGAPEASIPERSFIRATFDEYRQDYHAMLGKLLKRVIEDKLGVFEMFGLIGARMVADINRVVRQTQGPAFAFAPLKPATIARKGSSRPLIDTARMIAAVTWVVFLGGKKAGE